MSKAFIASITEVTPILIKGVEADNIQLATVLGEGVVVSKAWSVGTVGVFFPPDTQLSEDYCWYNNLFRDKANNNDTSKAGFFEPSRRVRCQPFCGAKSEGFFAGLESLNYTGINIKEDLKEGDSFDVINGHSICKKYLNEKTIKALKNKQNNGKKVKKVSTPLFSTHTDTDNFNYYAGNIKEGMLLSFHAKLHGTSFRVTHTKVVENPTGWKGSINSFFSGKDIFKKKEHWEYVAGSRRVTLFQDKHKEKEGYHGSEAFRFEVLDTFKGHLDKGMTVYGEICGYVNGKPIMGTHGTKALKDKAFTKKYGDSITYTYGCKETEYRFHVYRVSNTTEEGNEYDLTDAQVMKWCEVHGFLPPHEVYPPMIYDGNLDKLKELVTEITERPEVLCEDYIDPTHISEGIIIRCDRGDIKPKFFKSKSYPFKVLEGIVKEKEVDVEDAS